MKVCGFSFVRNGTTFDYPFKEALLSIEPLCDEIIVAVGTSDDDTLDIITKLHPKIKVLETIWEETKKYGGQVFALETNKAFQAISTVYDWAFYIQGDEVLHEQYLPIVKKAMEDNLADLRVDGLLFNYVHFFGSFNYVGSKYSWYRREVRVIRNNKHFYSYADAQGFRKYNGEKLQVRLIDAFIYHYGWVRNPKIMMQKIANNIKLYNHGEETAEIKNKEVFNYTAADEPVIKFLGTHPAIMQQRVAKLNWAFTPPSIKYKSTKDRLKHIIASFTGWIPGEYRNYKLLK